MKSKESSTATASATASATNEVSTEETTPGMTAVVSVSNDSTSTRRLDELMEILSEPEHRLVPLWYSTNTATTNTTGTKDSPSTVSTKTRMELLQICQDLFEQIEHLGQSYQSLVSKRRKKRSNNNDEKQQQQQQKQLSLSSKQEHALSGLMELHIPSLAAKQSKTSKRSQQQQQQHNQLSLEAETIWGQVDLQNEALLSILKKSVKKLVKSSHNVQVLDMNSILSDEEEDDDDDDSNENDNDIINDTNSDDDDDDDDEDVDEETRRMRQRMEQAMQDVDSGSDDDDEEEEEDDKMEKDATNALTKKQQQEDDESSSPSLLDPAAEELNDGFFDINEMEDFADEEEEYLPDEAFGKPRPKKSKNSLESTKKSFHQRLRDGDDIERSTNDDSNEDDDDDEEDGMNFDEESIRRKRYREDDEINALYSLYETPASDGDDDDDDDVVNMTAADLFGAPKKRYYEQYYKNRPRKQAEISKQDDPNNDDDSWGDYDFEKEDQETGWRDDSKKAPNDDDDEDNDDEEDQEDETDGEGDQDDNETNKIGGKSSRKDKSRHAQQSEKLQRQTEELEKEMLREKPWQMVGESTSKDRPVNSLLEGTPEFQFATKQAPVITVEHTANLEDIIKSRILAEDWDDVIPRELPDVAWHKKRGELPEVSQEKSKLGLGELYEREYLKKAVGYDVDAAEKQTEEDKAKEEMKQLFANLCSKLDALSNYHFAPRPVSEEAEVRPVTTPAIAMEEVLPLHVSDARGVAPQEVYATKRGREGVLRDDTELDQTDRKRLRSSKKAARRKARKEKLADEKLISRLSPGLGLNNPYEKRKLREELLQSRAQGKITMAKQDVNNDKFGSSGTFFKRLQSEVKQSIHEKTSDDNQEQRATKSKAKSSAYKL